MNENNEPRYTYGYNIGWNVRNEYIEDFQSIFDDYNEQLQVLKDLEAANTYDRSNDVQVEQLSDEELRETYNEYYHDSNISFEQYKQRMEQENQRRIEENQKAREEFDNKQSQRNDVYNANVRYLIDLKEEAARNINEKIRELELKLRQLKINEDQQNLLLLNARGDDAIQIRKKLDDIYLDSRKLEHAISELRDKLVEMGLTPEESALLMRGLNPREQEIYDDLISKKKKTSEPQPDPDPQPQPDPDPDPQPDQDSKFDNSTGKSLDRIIFKVCGNEYVSKQQSKKYTYSKIKIFNYPDYKKQGNSYKVSAFIPFVLGIVPKAFSKLRGKFLTSETKNNFREMEARAMDLTDAEVEKILKEYTPDFAASHKNPIFGRVVRKRLEKYVNERVSEYNKKIEKELTKVIGIAKAIDKIKSKLDRGEELTDKEKETIQDLYYDGCQSVMTIRKLQLEGSKVLNGFSSLHTFDEAFRSQNEMNLIGGRFAKQGYSPEVQSQLADYSDIMENSDDPKEVFEAFCKQLEVYVDNTERKRSILNLGSEVSSGKLEYNPFIQTTDYRNDDLVKNFLTSVMFIATTATLISSIANTIKVRKQEAELNQAIDANNNSIAGYNNLKNKIDGGTDTVRDGVVSRVNTEPGNIGNLSERANLDRANYDLSDPGYRASDAVAHAEADALYHNSQNAISQTSGLSAVQQSDALIPTMRGLDQSALKAANDAVGPTTSYAGSHSFPYDPFVGGINETIANPGAVTDAFEHMVGIEQLSEGLAPLQPMSNVALDAGTIIPAAVAEASVATKAGYESNRQAKIDSLREMKEEAKKVQEAQDDYIEAVKDGSLVSDEVVDNFIAGLGLDDEPVDENDVGKSM